MSEDSFDEFCDDISHRDWKQLEKSNYTVGYAEGKERGRELSQQYGFDIGYKSCSMHIDRLLRIKGLLQRCVLSSLQEPEKDPGKIKSALEKINAEQKRIVENLCGNQCKCSNVSDTTNKTPEFADCHLIQECTKFLKDIVPELNAALKESGFAALIEVVLEMAEIKQAE